MAARFKFGKHRGRTLKSTDIATFLTNLGFKIEQLGTHNLNILAFGRYKQEQAVFKLSTTLENSTRVRNEFNWNDAVLSIPKSVRPNFTVPRNFGSGYYKKLFYFIAERFIAESFTQGDILTRLRNTISQLAKVTWEIRNLPISPKSEFVKAQRPKPIGHTLLNVAKEWSLKIPSDVKTLVKLVTESKDRLRTSPGHGGFEVAHLYDLQGKIGLIDGELAGIGAMYYDAAFFYIRVRNDLEDPILAREYLRNFYNLLDPSDQKTFWQEIKPLLIIRYLGDLWGAAKNPKRLNELKPLGQEILNDRIL